MIHQCCHYSANEMQDKNKNKLIREGFSRFVDYRTTLHFFWKKHFNKQHQDDIWFKAQQVLVLKGVKGKININGSLAEQTALLLPNPYIHTNEKQCLPPLYNRQPPYFYKKILTLPSSISFQRSQPAINRGLHTINIKYKKVLSEMFCPNCQAA